MANNIHWFPGHMNKALHEVEEKLKLIDVVIELLDSRAPFSSINEQLEKRIAHKKKVIVMTKSDLSDPAQTDKWKKKLRNEDTEVIAANITDKNFYNTISQSVIRLGKAKWDKEMARGMKPQPIRTMIIGIPNVGKSSLVNLLSKRKAAGVQNKPGFTRGEQWIKVNKDFLLLDTPGILPMSYENKEKAANLALIGSIREDILPNSDLISFLLSYLKEHYPNALESRFGINEIGSEIETCDYIANKRGLLTGNGQLDRNKAEELLLKEFKDGLLGKITLEWL